MEIGLGIDAQLGEGLLENLRMLLISFWVCLYGVKRPGDLCLELRASSFGTNISKLSRSSGCARKRDSGARVS